MRNDFDFKFKRNSEILSLVDTSLSLQLLLALLS